MGQANNRGTFEQRKSCSVSISTERLEALSRVRAVEDANMTPEQRKKRKDAQMLLAVTMGLNF